MQRPDQPAIIESTTQGVRTLTFAELTERSARAAALLQASGLQQGDRVLVFQPMSIELYVALLAIFRLGLVATVLDPSTGRRQVEQCCSIAHPKAFIGPARAHLLRVQYRALRRIANHFVTSGWAPSSTAWTRLAQLCPLDSIANCNSSHPALLTFTSGSTGVPKAAVRSHGFLLAQYGVLSESIELEPAEIDLTTLPIFVLANLASGVTTVIPRGDLRRPGYIEPEPILNQLDRHRVTRTVGSPALYARLLGDSSTPIKRPRQKDLSGLRKLYTGGAPVFPPLLQKLSAALPECRVIVIYGSTEAEPITHLDWSEANTEDLEAMNRGQGLLVGRPVRQIAIRILPNQWGEPIESMTEAELAECSLPPETGGEIMVSGEHVLSGYLHGIGDEESKFHVEGKVWHRTGDAGYLDARGRLWLLGRAGAVIQDERGTIYPFAAECAASQFPWITRSALVTRGGKRLMVVELSERAPVTAEQYVKELLSWAYLDKVAVVPRVPVDRRHNAKIDYPQLEKVLDRHGY